MESVTRGPGKLVGVMQQQAMGFAADRKADILRALQKDGLYAEVLHESLLRASQDVLGALPTSQYSSELRLLSRAIYYAQAASLSHATVPPLALLSPPTTNAPPPPSNHPTPPRCPESQQVELPYASHASSSGAPTPLLHTRQTLGEEFCGLAQVDPYSATSQLPRWRHVLHVGLQSAVPYLLRKASVPQPGLGVPADQTLLVTSQSRTLEGGPPTGQGPGPDVISQLGAEHGLGHLAPFQGLVTPARGQVGPPEQRPAEALRQGSGQLRTGEVEAAGQLPGWVLRYAVARASRAVGVCKRAGSRLLAVVTRYRVLLAGLLILVVRCHVGWFYARGQHVEWAKRTAGVRYRYVGGDGSRRPNYSVLSWMVALAVVGHAVDLLPHIVALLPPPDRRASDSPYRQLLSSWTTPLVSWLTGAGGETLPDASQDGGGKPLAMSGSLDSAARPHGGSAGADVVQMQMQMQTEVGDSGGSRGSESVVKPLELDELDAHRRADVDCQYSVPQRLTCPLCLQRRRHATSTPCGHVFCWDCIAAWCAKKAECPLCRTPSPGGSLVRLYFSGM